MRNTITRYKHHLSNLLLLFVFSNVLVVNSYSTFAPECQYPGTVEYYSIQNCGLAIALDNGTRIYPTDNAYNLQEGERVLVSYQIIDTVEYCLSASQVEITCLTRLHDPSCKAILEILPSIALDALGFTYFMADNSEGNVIGRTWIIDGKIMRTTEPNINHTFSEYGAHTVCLSITTKDGCTDRTCETIYIGELEPCEADFSYTEIYPPYIHNSSNYINPEYCLEFIDQSYGDVVERYWSYHEMIISTDSITVYCPGKGSHEICLNITTSDGCSSSICKTITIPEYDSCNAAFIYTGVWGSDTLYTLNRFYVFEDHSEGQVLNWYWDFDDGTTSNEQNPYHEFPGPGVYDVCLTIVTAGGCSDTYCSTIIIDSIPDCNAKFEYCTYRNTDTIDSDELVIGFKSKPGSYSYTWSFGDGTHSDQSNPVHRYHSPGIYNVCLTVTTASCFSTICKDVYVGIDSCSVNYHHELLIPNCYESGYENVHYFNSLTHDDVFSHTWNFGDGTYGYNEDELHIFPSEGNYNVCLTVEYSNGCLAEQCQTIYNPSNDIVYYDKCGSIINSLSDNYSSLSDVHVYPIPATNEVFIEYSGIANRPATITLYNMQGQQVFSASYNSQADGINQINIQLDGFEMGTYYFKLTTNINTVTGKLSVIR